MTEAFEFLRGTQWLCPLESGGRQTLDEGQRDQVDVFLKCAKEKSVARSIEVLFRGETRARLAGRLCKDESAPLCKVATGLFFFGEKGKYFWRENVRRRQEEVDRQWSAVIRALDDVSVESFESLIYELGAILELKPAEAFCAKNPALSERVRSEVGRSELVRRFDSLGDLEKRWVRDLFVYVIHTFSRQEHKNYTPFVSTTPDIGRSKRFAKAGSANSDDPCIICLFLPANSHQRAIRSTEIKANSRKLERLGFPPIAQVFFNEKEVALFGGIYPHYVFAVCDLASKKSFWNPALFSASSGATSEIWKSGFPIDQQDFEVRLPETGYAKGVQNSNGIATEIYPK